MTHDEFVNKYTEIAKRALKYSEKARKEGLLSLEDDLDRAKINVRDIFEYGMSFVIDGVDYELIEEILTNIIKQEKDEDMIILKNIQKDAVLMIQAGTNPRLLCALLNSHTDITLQEDEIQKQWGVE
jgi:flagellar motor component MotA